MNQKRVVFWVCLVGLILILNFVCTSYAKTAKDIAQKVFPSVVMLVMEDSNGQPLSLGSGFFVQEDVVATNLHVIEDAAGGYAKIVGKKQKYNIAGYVAIDYKRDLILLKIEKAKALPIDIGNSDEVAIGDEIFAVGNPKGLEGTFSKGIVSAIRKFEKDSLLQITAPISPGSSGGPVLNKEGKVIGIAVATFKGGQNLNFAIPAS
ncbi:MAG: trypsin-like peptidase domain-containing protein [Sedimentisphaerales bacterium]|nr:trypsin-like peptidase domain-containing protein [Sedimentisphaerales bacterium]